MSRPEWRVVLVWLALSGGLLGPKLLRWLRSPSQSARNRLLGRLLRPDADKHRYQLAHCEHFSIDLVVTKGFRIPPMQVWFYCRFHQPEAVRFQLASGRGFRNWSQCESLTKAMRAFDNHSLQYRYRGDFQQLDAALTSLAPTLETVRPISLHGDLLICQWLWPEECLRQPLEQANNELAFALQKVLLAATRITGRTLPVAALSPALAPDHDFDYRRNALRILFDGNASPERRAALVREPVSTWHDFGSMVALMLGQPVDEALFQANYETLPDPGREMLLETAALHHWYPGVGRDLPSNLSHELLAHWLSYLMAREGQETAVPHLIACYYEGVLPPRLVIEKLWRADDARLTAFLVNILLHGPLAHRSLALAELQALDWESWGDLFHDYAPNLSDEVRRYLVSTFHDGKTKLSQENSELERIPHLELGPAFGETLRFKLLLQDLWAQDDPASIPHLIACYHLPYMRGTVLAFIGRDHDARVLGFLHEVLRNGTSSEVKSAVQGLHHYGDASSVTHLTAVYARQSRGNRKLIDLALTAIAARDPAAAGPGALSVVGDETAGAVAVFEPEARAGAVSRVGEEKGNL